MFKKILIANRGEIACRVIQTAHRMGIETVAVYSDADRTARHVRMAGQAVPIGGAASADSYLRGDAVLKAAQGTGAQAIHPGYGFLSENEDFAASCEQAGIKFIGPSAHAIREMGLKDRAKLIMQKAGVPIVPGYLGEKQDAETLRQEAVSIGFPVLIKAVAGGGGKGMRLVEREADFAESLQSCKREAKASFGNDHVMIEKYITKPRHVEVQVFGDSHGNAVYLFERDCSLQRRHQKVVEEAPAPGLPDSVRKALGQAALKAVKALSYENAGTIEFIMDSRTHDFYFMEMNTRLQVEHPVTEMITGLDLVEWQLRVASGESLPLKQEQVKAAGHAFEVRLYAEDPAGEFLPQTGKIAEFKCPSARVDTGVEKGDEVTIYYDPMIAKIIVHGANREEALHKMRAALAGTAVSGLRTNQEFLANIFTQPAFIDGDIDTGFIARHMNDLIPPDYGQPDETDRAIAAAYFLMGLNRLSESGDPWDSCDHWRMNGIAQQSLKLMTRGGIINISARCAGPLFSMPFPEKGAAEEEKKEKEIAFLSFADNVLTVSMNEKRASAIVHAHDRNLTLFRNGRVIDLHLYIHGSGDDEEAGEGSIVTPMPGRIVDVLVKQGDTVEKGQPLLVMEAMKMEMTIRAGCAGIVEKLAVNTNDQVQDGAFLVSIAGEPETTMP